MERIKSVISHGHKKSADADSPTTADQSRMATNTGLTGEGSHLAGAHQSQKDAPAEGYHPIYDQFTGHDSPATSGEPIKTTENPPHFSNTTEVKRSPPTSAGALSPSSQTNTSTPTSSLRPDATHGRPGNLAEDASTASIKSGVIGFTQGTSSEHAAMAHDNQAQQNLDRNQVVGGGNPGQDVRQGTAEKDFTQPTERRTDQTFNQPTERDTTQTVHSLADRRTEQLSQQPADQRVEHRDSHLGENDALGAGAIGAGGLAAHEYNKRHEHDSKQESQPYEQSLQDHTATTGTDRSFPLAGGVTSRQPAGNPSSLHKSSTNEREPGTKDKEVGVRDGHGREALAGAAAAATASSAHPREHQKDVVNTQQETRPQDSHHPDALAAATTAAARAPASHSKGEYDHVRRGHAFVGDPCATDTNGSTADQNQSGLLYTEGPHKTDIANRADPRLHIPGEFPSPTPIDESKEPSYSSHPGLVATEASTAASGQHELRHTGTLDQPQTRPTDQLEKPTSEHHYGRDAVLAGGAGAATLGAYEASKRHQREPTDIGNETYPMEASPYSSTKLDPRVDGKAPSLENQKFDPLAPSKVSPHESSQQHHARDTTLASGALTGHEVSKHHEAKKRTEPSTGQHEVSQPTPDTQDEKSRHHYGRDATLVGAGAATAGGLYYATRPDEKPESGPASSTIGPHKSNVANVVDPKVQPDPALQRHHNVGPTSEDPATRTVGPHKSNVANIVDPRVQPQPEKQKGYTTTGPHQSDTLHRLDPRVDEKAQPHDQHHYGRDAAIAGGTGAAGYGAFEAAKKYDEHRATQAGASMNEQRYDPTAPGAHDPSKVTIQHGKEPSQKEHHYNREAAVAGGIGAAGAGAYAASHGNGHNQQPLNSQQQYQAPTSQDAQNPHIQGNQYPNTQTSQYPVQTAQDPKQQQQHHYGRDAAVAGGLATAGAGTYAATREQNQPTRSYDQQPLTSQQGLEPTTGTHQRYDSVQDPNAQDKNQHQKRDTSALAAGGVAAGAGGAYTYNQHEAEKERLAQEKAHAKELEQQRKEAQKAQERQMKEQQKEFEKKQKEIEKEQAKEKKHHDKLVAAEEKKHQKEINNEAKERQKEEEKLEKEKSKEAERAEKEREDEENGKDKKKHHLFGFLHRDKKDKEKDTTSAEGSPRESKDSPRHSKEYVAAGAGGAAAYEATQHNDSDAGTGSGSDSPGRKHRNKLHKDPPPGHPAREALEQQQEQEQEQGLGGKHQHVGIDGPIGDPNQVSGN